MSTKPSKPSKLRRGKSKQERLLEKPTESEPRTRKFGPYSTPGEGLAFNLYTTDANYKISDVSQNRHVQMYDKIIEDRIKELEKKGKVNNAVMSESLAHRLLLSSEHDVRKMISSLVDPTKHNP